MGCNRFLNLEKKKIVFPAEYSMHSATIAMIPHRGDIWRNNALNMQQYIINLVKIVSRFEHVYLIYNKRCNVNITEIKKLSNVTLVEMDYTDIWTRDISPTFVYIDGVLTCLNWKFNAWGGKASCAYSPWDEDNEFAENIAKYFNLPIVNVPITLEGGAIIGDGKDSIYTTQSVLLNGNRNPFKSKEFIENILKTNLGASNVVWLKQGLATDETNGHVDNILSVVSEKEIAIAWTDNPNNPNYKRVRCIWETLKRFYHGTIHKIDLPTLQYMTNEEAMAIDSSSSAMPRKAGDLLPASYLNLYFVNGGVLVPTFGCTEDDLALEQFKRIFRDREIVPIYSREPLLGGGGIHCLLHEIPI